MEAVRFKLLLVCCIAAAAPVVVYLAARPACRILKVKLDACLVTDRDSTAAARVPRASTPVG